MDWSLLGCGTSGHVTFAPDEPALRDRLNIATREGPAWRCLRCGTFVTGEPQATGPAAEAPRVRRAEQVRSALILRIFAVERFFRALIFAALAIAVWRFSVSRLSIEQAYDQALPPLKALLRDFGFSVQHSKLLGLVHKAFTADPRTLGYIALGLGAYAVIEVIEGIGLWLVKRWGEYFAMIVTSLGLPYEIYDLTNKVTVLRVVAFVINLALVLYLVLTKRLFGVRGGKKAYEAKLRSESILDAEMAALAAEQSGAAGREATAHAAAAGNSAPAAGPPAAGPAAAAGLAPPDAETPATAGPLWPDAETPDATRPPWPDAGSPATAEPSRTEAETPATAGPPWPDAESPATARPSRADAGTPATAGPPWPNVETPATGPLWPDAETPATEPTSAEAAPAISEAAPAPAEPAPAPAEPTETADEPAPSDAADGPAPPLPRRRRAR
jgi:uncharacterized membrane protein (DUF2068 family)